jgi:hypothetical protein
LTRKEPFGACVCGEATGGMRRRHASTIGTRYSEIVMVLLSFIRFSLSGDFREVYHIPHRG